MKKILFIIIGLIVFPTTCIGAYSQSVQNIILEANKKIQTIQQESQRLRAQNIVNNSPTLDLDLPNGQSCVENNFSTFTQQVATTVYPFDTGFYFTFTDTLYQNACLLEDIWEIEDTIEKIYAVARDVSKDCSPQTSVFINELSNIQKSLVIDIALLREYGNSTSSNGTPKENNLSSTSENNNGQRVQKTLKHKYLEENYFEDIQNEKLLSEKLATPYFSSIYFDFNKQSQPNGCKLEYNEDIEERIENLKNNLALLSNPSQIFDNVKNGFQLTERDKAKIRSESKRNAQRIFQGLFAGVDLGIIRTEFIFKQTDNDLSKEKSAQEKLENSKENSKDGEVEIEGSESLTISESISKSFNDVYNELTTVQSNSASKQSESFNNVFIATQEDLYDALEKNDLREITQAETNAMKAEYLLLFSESQNQITNHLVMKLHTLQTCIRRGHEKNPEELKQLGCRVNPKTGTIIPDEEFSLHNFANKLLDFANQQCKSVLPQCIDLPFI